MRQYNPRSPGNAAVRSRSWRSPATMTSGYPAAAGDEPRRRNDARPPVDCLGAREGNLDGVRAELGGDARRMNDALRSQVDGPPLVADVGHDDDRQAHALGVTHDARESPQHLG